MKRFYRLYKKTEQRAAPQDLYLEVLLCVFKKHLPDATDVFFYLLHVEKDIEG